MIRGPYGPGCLFFAIRGTRLDGNRFMPKAIAKGAAAVSFRAGSGFRPLAMPWIQVDDERAAMAAMAANFYGHPTRKLHLIGVTGTNGKTTTTYIVESILKAAGKTGGRARHDRISRAGIRFRCGTNDA